MVILFDLEIKLKVKGKIEVPDFDLLFNINTKYIIKPYDYISRHMTLEISNRNVFTPEVAVHFPLIKQKYIETSNC